MEKQIGFLYNAASTLRSTKSSNSLALLKSYYLMRCSQLTRGSLRHKHFSSKVRCSRCYTEWTKGTQIKIKNIKLSKKQRHRTKSSKVYKDNRDDKNKIDSVLSNEIQQVCTFCKHITVSHAGKPVKLKKVTKESGIDAIKIKTAVGKAMAQDIVDAKNKKTTKQEHKVIESPKVKQNKINVYSNTVDVFALNNQKNSLKRVKETKVTKTNIRKKDKFAGLCQKAVLASAKLKEEQMKNNKLNLFLKPST